MPVVQRQCLGRDSAENSGGSAVAVLLGRPVLGQRSLTCPLQFFDKVADVPVVLVLGGAAGAVLAVMDVSVIML